ncbi:hypothetical protein X801_03023 [Opisthorchis viverrini]|uniref:Uncharacterized protein n=2 Tax=Opisthorchis viverrini TaxID=6198 RepID=A0A1S8X333_OPIVI|nr:hypothetical protein T265_02871 [Opisthorchis viverrini]KER30720.1 hypothetical protein T265_02871 [Opisthorchis viverrini]OON21087.1 hypothetical protein X801_03023 [Opisthorchis viverrini]
MIMVKQLFGDLKQLRANGTPNEVILSGKKLPRPKIAVAVICRELRVSSTSWPIFHKFLFTHRWLHVFRHFRQLFNQLRQHQLAEVNEEWDEANRQVTLASAHGISSNVAGLVHMVSQGPQFIGQVARVTNEASEAQQPVFLAGLFSLAVLRAARKLVTNARLRQPEHAFVSFFYCQQRAV